jgi:ADP-heptose:LPS heptosyltransferase
MIGKELRAAVVLTGAPSDREYCGKIAEGMDPRPVVAAGALTLGQAAALIRRADLLVSGDTGPLHIAAAVGTRSIGLYGSVNTERSRPIGQGHVVLKREMWCLPCEEKVCPLSTTQCMKDIAAEEVFAEVRKALDSTASRRGGTDG